MRLLSLLQCLYLLYIFIKILQVRGSIWSGQLLCRLSLSALVLLLLFRFTRFRQDVLEATAASLNNRLRSLTALGDAGSSHGVLVEGLS